MSPDDARTLFELRDRTAELQLEGRLGALEYAMVAVRSDNIDTRAEANRVGRELSEKFGKLSADLKFRSKIERLAVFLGCCALVAIAVVVVYQAIKAA